MRLRYLIASALSASFILASCTPSATKDTTSTSSTTVKPSNTKKEEIKEVAKSTETKTTQDSSQKFQEVKIEGLQTYKHSSGLFQIDIPTGWAPNDTSKPGETIVVWFDPSQNALIAVDIFKIPDGATPEKLTELLQNFLKSTFGAKPSFSMEKPMTQSDGSIQIIWGFDETVKGVTAKIQGNSFIAKQGDKASLLTTGAIQAQFPTLQASFNKIVNSFKVDAAVKVP
jgi:subtilisin family serine protease